eukprot:COSAG03_NODE_14078_length_478_cov_0.622691_1_plen_129_part_10
MGGAKPLRARATRSNSPGLVVWAPCGGAWPVVPRYKPRSSRFAAVFRQKLGWSTKIRPFLAKNRFSQLQGAGSAANGGYGGAPRKLQVRLDAGFAPSRRLKLKRCAFIRVPLSVSPHSYSRLYLIPYPP